MFKRNDLTKQFELIVQQEIKNYQDSRNSILECLRNLKDEIKKNKEISDTQYATLHSECHRLKISLDNLKQSQDWMAQSLEKSINDQASINQNTELDLSFLSTDTLSLSEKVKSTRDLIDQLKKQISSLEDRVHHNQRITVDNLDDLLRRFREEIAKCKKEILESPTEAQKVKTQLEEKLSCHVVDVDGIMRELHIYKHDNMVTQKKIEHLYTLVERLKKQGVPCGPSFNH